jgi:hypothetical protein
MNGRIWFTCCPGEGTVFQVLLPLNVPTAIQIERKA